MPRRINWEFWEEEVGKNANHIQIPVVDGPYRAMKMALDIG